jgi:hypothetical protein
MTGMDTSGAHDHANNWSIGGRTRHVNVQIFFLWELKDNGMMVTQHIPRPNSEADIIIKNVNAGPLHRQSDKPHSNDGLLNM